MKFKKNAFTLIELLVTIVIIGILSTIAISTFSGYFAKARDAKRISTMRDLNKAVLLYYSQKGELPCKINGKFREYMDDDQACLPKTLIAEGFLDSFDGDPKYGNNGKSEDYKDYMYEIQNIKSVHRYAYILRTHLESNTLKRTHSHPDGTYCQLPKYPKCNWFQGDCVYVAGNTCKIHLLHYSKNLYKK